MNPPSTIQELADDVRKLINHLHQHGVLGLHPGIDFNAITLITEDGQQVEVAVDGIEIEVPASIIRKVRWYCGR